MEYLPAYLAEVLGSAFLYQAVMLISYVLLISIRRIVWQTVDRYH